ncbi:hypothetical protein GE09DRAFT_662570 [Coniochaeta sp. 2T2.1]|nr:hypothetical protein GE09DRAFT_662570 [Coniochaeta sp. 2T2.1]
MRQQEDITVAASVTPRSVTVLGLACNDHSAYCRLPMTTTARCGRPSLRKWLLIARTQLRKRQRRRRFARPPSQQEDKSTGEPHQRNFPPEFWDGLSKVPLTRRALRELDRRNSAQTAPLRLQ